MASNLEKICSSSNSRISSFSIYFVEVVEYGESEAAKVLRYYSDSNDESFIAKGL